jgi:hypothetical protein
MPLDFNEYDIQPTNHWFWAEIYSGYFNKEQSEFDRYQFYTLGQVSINHSYIQRALYRPLFYN